MPIYLNAFIMLLATIAAFVVLAKLANHIRAGRLLPNWRGRSRANSPAAEGLIEFEQSCVIDGKRRLLSVRCGPARVFILTGGPADLVISQCPLHSAQGDQV